MASIENTSQTEDQHSAQAESSTGAQLPDKRASNKSIQSLQAKADSSNSVVKVENLQKKVQQKTSLSNPSQVIQQKRVTNLAGANVLQSDNIVHFADGAATVSRLWQVNVGDKATRNELLKAIAEEGTSMAGKIAGQVGGNWNHFNASKEDQQVNYYDPVRVRIKGRYGNNPKRNLSADYHFGESWDGYVISVVDDGNAINHKMKKLNLGEQLGQGEYSSIHGINDDSRIANQGDADAVTKILGEGARWKAVAENVAALHDNSKIYTNENNNQTLTAQVRYVFFKVLWKSWAATFGKAYGIPDTTVVDKLKGANIQITTHAGVVDSAVGTTNANQLIYNKDISVDSDKPANQIDLTHDTVRYLVYSYDEEDDEIPVSAVESDQTLAQLLLSLRQRVGGEAQVTAEGYQGYIGNNKFAILVTTPVNHVVGNVDKFSEEGGLHGQAIYPRYRKPKLQSLAKQSVQGPQMEAGPVTFDTEKKALYDDNKGVLSDFIEQVDIDEVEGINHWGEIIPDTEDSFKSLATKHFMPDYDVDEQVPAPWEAQDFDARVVEWLEQKISELETSDDEL